MGQKSLNFSENKCIRPPYCPTVCQLTYQTTQPYCKFPVEPREETGHQRRFTTEELLRWTQRLSKAKIASRKQHDLRREVLLYNAFIFAQSEIKFRQLERQKRWRELKPLLSLEGSGCSFVAAAGSAAWKENMAAAAHKMADDVDKMAAVEEMDLSERPSTPLPNVTGAVKRRTCGCPIIFSCHCTIMGQSKKCRPFTNSKACDDLHSLDQFLSSLQSSGRQVG